MNFPRPAPVAYLSRCLPVVAACTAFVAPFAQSQALSPGTPVMLNQACPACNVYSASLFLDHGGNVFANYVFQTPTGQRPYRSGVSHFSASTGRWGASPIGLPPDSSDGVEVDYDGRGNALAVWSTFDDGAIVHKYAYFSGQQRRWSRAVQFWVTFEGGGTETRMSRNGSAIIEGYSRGGQPLFHFDPVTRTLRERGVGDISTDFALDDQGNAIHLSVDRAWSASVPQHVHAMRYDAATKSWQESKKLNPDFRRDDGLRTDYPEVVIDRNGNGMGLWSYGDDINGVPNQMASVRYLPRTGQFTVKKIPVTGNGPVYGASLATDGASNVYAVWSQQMEGSISKIVFAKYSSTSGAWSTPRVIQSGTRLAWNPKIAADQKGNLVAAWIQQNSAGKYVQTAARYSIAANTWGRPVTVQTKADANSYGTELVVDNNGRATLVWLQEGLPLLGGNPTFKLMASRLAFKP